MQNFSLYNIRKAARATQDALLNNTFGAPPAEPKTTIRRATTTDSWGPSTKDLEKVVDQTVIYDSFFVVDFVFARIWKYLPERDPDLRCGWRYDNKSQSQSSELYGKAVSYLNSGNEWRIVWKCLKVVEYLIFHLGIEMVIKQDNDDGDYRALVEYVAKVYGTKVDILKDQGEATVTAAQLAEMEHYKSVVVEAERLLRLIDDAEFREKEEETALKMYDQRGTSHGNDAKLTKEQVFPSYMSGYKEKTLDRSKIQHSNSKAEVKNYLGHHFHPKERKPGIYQVAGKEAWAKPESLLDGEGDGDDYDDEDNSGEVHYNDDYNSGDNDDNDNDDGYYDHGGYHDTPYDTPYDTSASKAKSTDSFGSFEGATAESQHTPDLLISFEEPDTPQTPWFDTSFDLSKKSQYDHHDHTGVHGSLIDS